MSDIVISQNPVQTQSHIKPREGRLLRWFTRYAPHSTIKPDNPVRSYELRDAPTIRQLFRQSIRWAMYPAVLLLAVYAVFAVAIVVEGKPQVYFLPHLFHQVESALTLLFLIATIGVYLVMDFIGITRSMNSISHEFDNANWDLIALADMDSKRFLWGKHASAQIRPWKYMCLTMGLRVAVVIMAIVHRLIHAFMLNPPQVVWDRFIAYPLNLLAIILLLLTAIVVLVTYLIEPYWHLRLMVAAGLIGSAKNTHHTMRVLTGMGQIAGMWGMQLGIVMLTFMVMYIFSMPSQNMLRLIPPEQAPFVNSLVIFIVVNVGMWSFYSMYQVMIKGTLTGAARFLVRKGAAIELPSLKIRRLFITGLIFPLVVVLYASIWMVIESNQPPPPAYLWNPYFIPDGAYATYVGIINWLWTILLVGGFIFASAVGSLAINYVDVWQFIGAIDAEPLEVDSSRIAVRNIFAYLSGLRLIGLLLVSVFLSLGAPLSYNLGLPIAQLSRNPFDYLLGLAMVIVFAFYCYKEPLWRANAYLPFFKHFHAHKRRMLIRVVHGFVYFVIFVGVEFIITYTAIHWFGIFAWDVLFDPNIHLWSSGFDLLRLLGVLSAVYGVYWVIIRVLGRYIHDDKAGIRNDLLHTPVSLSDGRVV